MVLRHDCDQRTVDRVIERIGINRSVRVVDATETRTRYVVRKGEMQTNIRIRKSLATGVVVFATAGAVLLPTSAPASAATSATTVATVTTSNSASAGAVAPAETPTVQPSRRKKRARANVRTGPSRWRGKRVRHPNGRKFPRSVRRWANLVKSVMREHRIKRRYLRGILAQIQQESGGNPNAVNRWDSNARRGTPSKGLLQVIAPTYRAYAKRGFRSTRYQKVPYTNIWASLKYVKKTYGKKKFRSWNRGHNQGY